MLVAVLLAALLLLAGFALRAGLRPLQALFVPASVVGGLVGLALIQGMTRLDAVPAVAGAARDLASTWRGWPGPLIAVVFAGLLLERPERPWSEAMRGAALGGIMVWIIVLGEVALGLAATWFLIAPVYDVPPAFGQLIEAGFAGGHGTAAALGAVYGEVLAFPDGLDLGLFMATVGLVYSVLSGIALVNIGVRRGWTRAGRGERRLVSGLEPRRAPSPVAYGRVRGEVIDPFAFQLLLVALAVLVGMILQRGFVVAAGVLSVGDGLRYLENVPLFLFTLIGGLLVRKSMTALGLGDLIDGESVKRIVAVSMEFLIVAAMASLRLEAVVTYAMPLAILVTLGCGWAAFCLVPLSRLLLPASCWFELGIINYGMSTGTTAQGMMLLRIVDEDLESGAAELYALAAPLSAPFIGGGVITLTMPVLLDRVGIPPVVGVLVVLIVALAITGRLIKVRGER